MARVTDSRTPLVARLRGVHFNFDGAPCAQRMRFALAGLARASRSR